MSECFWYGPYAMWRDETCFSLLRESELHMLTLIFFFNGEGVFSFPFFVIVSRCHQSRVIVWVRIRCFSSKSLAFSLIYLFFSKIYSFVIIIEKGDFVNFQFCKYFFFVFFRWKREFAFVSNFLNHITFSCCFNQSIFVAFFDSLSKIFFFYKTMIVFDFFRSSIFFFVFKVIHSVRTSLTRTVATA